MLGSMLSRNLLHLGNVGKIDFFLVADMILKIRKAKMQLHKA